MDGLEYIVDGRNTEPNVDGYRKGRFKACWKDAAERNKKYDAGTLELSIGNIWATDSASC